LGITDIKLTFEVDTDADSEKIARMVQMAERYCVIAQTLHHPPKITIDHRIV